jgi:hypothetical protein
MKRLWLVVALAACGDDGGNAPNPPPTGAAPKTQAAAPGAGSNKTLLPEKLHVEDRIACAVPDKPTDEKNGKCDLKAPSCGEHLYCLQLAQGTFCEPCPERDGIRHVFRERDFAAEQNRDPFEAGGTIGPRTPGTATPPTERCRENQLVATSFSVVDLKLVGIVAQGTQRKVLMMGGPLGYIIKRGDCVGKEKAVVTDIGTGFISFQPNPDQAAAGRPPAEYSVQLNPKQLAANDPGDAIYSSQRTTIAPVVAPPPTVPPAAPLGRPGTTVVVPQAPSQVVPAMTPGAQVAPTVVPPVAAPNLPPAAAGAGSASSVPIVAPGGPTSATPAPTAVPAGSAAPAPAPAPAQQRVFVAPPK